MLHTYFPVYLDHEFPSGCFVVSNTKVPCVFCLTLEFPVSRCGPWDFFGTFGFWLFIAGIQNYNFGILCLETFPT